jgi:glyoxylase-like metal-dependent hydrolase (beta-lactamase superfamily II)
MSQPFRIAPPADFSIARWEPFRGRPTHLLADGDLVDLGGRVLTVLHTPGHSPGHICVYEERRGYLITGDVVYRGELHAFYPSTDPIAFRASVHRLCTLPHVQAVLPGHHDLGLDRSDLLAVAASFDELHEKGLLRHGTGKHTIGRVRIRL